MTYVSKTIVPGATLVATWGYEQTNADFFRVIAVKGQWATLQRLKTINTWKGNTMQGAAVPGELIGGKLMRRKVQAFDFGDYCATNSFSGGAKAWDGKPVAVSCYA